MAIPCNLLWDMVLVAVAVVSATVQLTGPWRVRVQFEFVEGVVLRDRAAAEGQRLVDLEVAAKLLSRARPLLYSLAAGSLQEVLQPEIFGLFGSPAIAALDVLDEVSVRRRHTTSLGATQ